jgi:hypothetical protein
LWRERLEPVFNSLNSVQPETSPWSFFRLWLNLDAPDGGYVATFDGDEIIGFDKPPDWLMLVGL